MNPAHFPTFPLRIEFLNWWHAGTGEAGDSDLDAKVIRDDLGLPFLPGKTVKGLFRDAARFLLRSGRTGLKEDDLPFLFGSERPPGAVLPRETPAEGALHFSNALLPPSFRDWVRTARPAAISGLFDTLAATAIQNGVAKQHTLRKIEVTVPVTLTAKISLLRAAPDGLALEKVLQDCASLIRKAGSHRHRGLGRCRFELKPEIQS